MFYSHDLLTSPQYGVATVWLVATLGSKSNLKKVTRRAILDVDLPKACQAITEPEAPLALRLQGSLLFGVSRVYAQQCGYVLTDVTNLRDKMNMTVQRLQALELNPDVGKTRPEQLNLAEDPYFNPSDLDFDLSAFGLSTDDSSLAASLSLAAPPSSRTSLLVDELDDPSLELPVVDEPPAIVDPFDAFINSLGADTDSVAQAGSGGGQLFSPFGGNPAYLEDPVFDVDEDGNLLPAIPTDFPSGRLSEGPDRALVDESGLYAHGSHESATSGIGNGQVNQELNFDDVIMAFDDGEPNIVPNTTQVTATAEQLEDQMSEDRAASASNRPEEESSETAEAPQRKQRPIKSIRPDRRTELSNRDLNEWNQNYLANMAAALQARQNQTSRSEAKRNAEYWIFEQGIGNIASTFGEDTNPHPLAIFSGPLLWNLLRNPQPSPGKKRSHGSSAGSDEESEGGRRVRPRTTPSDDVARGVESEALALPDDDGLMLQGSDSGVEKEVGRQAPSSLPDHSSGMPWNTGMSGSRQGSAQPPIHGFLPRLSSSAGGLSAGMDPGFGPSSAFGRRGSRFTTASPLLGKGVSLPRPLSRLGSQEPIADEPPQFSLGNEDDFANLDAMLGANVDADFELYGPSATVDTQTAAQSQWVAATLENEAFNFLAFVDTKIQELDDHTGDVGEMATVTVITFDALLPPARNSQIVGAQALLHVLALATKGLLEVHQAEPFGEIEISVANHRNNK